MLPRLFLDLMKLAGDNESWLSHRLSRKVMACVACGYIVLIVLIAIMSGKNHTSGRSFDIQIKPMKSEVLTGEPVIMEITYTNISAWRKKVFKDYRAGFQCYSPVATSHDGEKYEIATGMSLHSYGYGDEYYVTLSYGESFTSREVMRKNIEGPLWPKPGVYSIEMIPDLTEYPKVSITARTPEGRDAEAFKIWCEYLFEKDPVVYEASKLRLMGEYPDSVYGQWMVFFVVKSYTASHPTEYRGSALDRLNHEFGPLAPVASQDIKRWESIHKWANASSSELLTFLIEKHPEFPLVDECKARLARLQPKDEHRKRLKALITEYPDSPVAWMARDDIYALDHGKPLPTWYE